MFQGTTPALTFYVPNFDATGMKAFVSFKKSQEVIIAYDTTNSRTVVVCQLTQQETLDMRTGEYDVQIRFIDASENAYATGEAKLDVSRVLYHELIAYE